MANWGNRVRGYHKQINALKKSGWITPTEYGQAINMYNSDYKFQKLIETANNRRLGAANVAKHKAGLVRVGGLPKPPVRNIPDKYYQQFLGISKADLLAVGKFEAEIRETRGGTGGGPSGGWQEKPDRYKSHVPSIADVEYVIGQKYASAYDPGYAGKQLRGNSKWESQNQYVSQYANYAKGIKAQAGQARVQTAAQKAAAKMKGIRRNTVLSSWAKTGKFPTELRGAPSRASSSKYPGQNALNSITGASAAKVISRSRLAGIGGSTQARRLSVTSRSGGGTRATSLGTARATGGTKARKITKKKSTGTGTRARRL